MSIKRFSVNTSNVVDGNHTVSVGLSFEISDASGNPALHAWRGTEDKCAELVDNHCPLPCNTSLTVRERAPLGVRYQLGTDPANDGGSDPDATPSLASNGKLTVGGG